MFARIELYLSVPVSSRAPLKSCWTFSSILLQSSFSIYNLNYSHSKSIFKLADQRRDTLHSYHATSVQKLFCGKTTPLADSKELFPSPRFNVIIYVVAVPNYLILTE